MSYAVNFTPTDLTKMIRCDRPECGVKFFPAGTEMKYMHPQKDGQVGRTVCPPCYHYYKEKIDTMKRDEPDAAVPARSNPAPMGLLNPDVRKEVSCSQRGESTLPVQHIGQALLPYGTSMPPPPLPPMPINYSGIYHQAPSFSNRPSIYLPGHSYGPSPLTRPPPIPQAQGYTSAHPKHAEMTCIMQQNVYAGHASGGHNISIKVSLVHLPPGKSQPVQISNITETIGDIPVHITTEQLKDQLCTILESRWNKYSPHMPLPKDLLVLRHAHTDRKWVILTPGNPGIASLFYKPPRKTGLPPVFKTGVYSTFLELPNDVLEEVHDLGEQVEFKHPLPTHGSSASTSHTETQRTSQKRSYSTRSIRTHSKGKATATTILKSPTPPRQSPEQDSDTESTQFDDPVTPPSKHACLIGNTTSPDKVLLQKALLAQTSVNTSGVSNFFSTTIIDILIFPIEARSVDDLLQSPTWDSALGTPFSVGGRAAQSHIHFHGQGRYAE
ncbi:hypothetical protein DFH07DRAFT_768117 [Mycena maculata]|uniref:Uncharacterized protein n=1 Tax=Mycena maculata TaxID=230809 RepID=A0AAD7NRC3_9AGAR|nr:hypothetical protein DFH07DRAFT_768117 [Mycena maculata]